MGGGWTVRRTLSGTFGAPATASPFSAAPFPGFYGRVSQPSDFPPMGQRDGGAEAREGGGGLGIPPSCPPHPSLPPSRRLQRRPVLPRLLEVRSPRMTPTEIHIMHSNPMHL